MDEQSEMATASATVPAPMIPGVPAPLAAAAQAVKGGSAPEVTVRELLAWFDSARRRKWVLARIRAALRKVGLVTVPDFEGEWLDSKIIFADQAKHSTKPTIIVATTTTTPAPKTVTEEGTTPLPSVDPSHRLGRLKAAHAELVSVKAEESLERATTLMLMHDYSQLPVMANDREVKGMISWKSIGSRMVLGKPCKIIRDCMGSYFELSEDASIFDALAGMAKHDCVLVRRHDRTISGIVTATDINDQFRQLAEPFLLIADIETRLRTLIEPGFTVAELEAAKNPEDKGRKIENVSDLSLGECIRLLESADRWPKLKLSLDRKEFISQLDAIRETRNDVMHFDPDGIGEDSIEMLRSFAGFLSRLQTMAI